MSLDLRILELVPPQQEGGERTIHSKGTIQEMSRGA